MWPFTSKSAPVPEAKGLASADAELWGLFGVEPAPVGVPTITAADALKVPAVGAAIRLIAEAVATLDVHVVRKGEDGFEAPVDHPVLPFLAREANDWTGGFEMIRDLVIDALTDDVGGIAHVICARGEVREIVRYRPGVVSVEFDTVTGEPSFKVDGDERPASDFIHLRSPFGRSPLSLYREAIATARALDHHAARFFGNGARPTGALTFARGMPEDAVKKIRAAWAAAHERGAGGTTAMLYDGAEFQPLTFSSTDAEFTENRRHQIIEVARAFRVPPPMIAALERATWANGEQQGREFLSYCLEPWLRATEGALSRALLTRQERVTLAIRFDRDDLTRADLATRATVINSLIAARVLNPNEARSWLGMAPYEGGDQFANPNTMSPDAAPDEGDDEAVQPPEAANDAA